jgi:NADPH-dependent 2,4-dienoyl-CoA reductase/sulfur reductase-like enzyme
MVVPEDGVSARIFPADLTAHVTGYYREKGVEVLTGASVAGIDGELGAFKVSIEAGETLDAAVVVAGLGIVPATELAEAAGLEVDNGIVVDSQARAGRDDVFAAGDIARFPSAVLGESTRVEHEDHAKSHGKLAGRNMAGAGETYDHLPFFYSDLFDLGYEAVGNLDSTLETVADWDGGFGKGIVYYLDESRRPRGVLLWNVWDTVPAATELIAAGEPIEERRLDLG